MIVPRTAPRGDADRHADGANPEGPFQVVPADGDVVVAQGLQRRDLRSLQRQRARQGNVQDEGGDDQEDQREHEAEALKLCQLVLDRPMRQLERAGNGAETSVRLEEAIDLRNDFFARRSGRQRKSHVVEATLHVEGGSQRLLVHPEDAEPLVVWDELAGADAVDVLGR